MARHPDIRAKLDAEVDQVVGVDDYTDVAALSKKICPELLDQMTQLNYFVKEVL